MIKIGNSLIALSVLGVMLVGIPTASDARGRGTVVQKHRYYPTYRSGDVLYPDARYRWNGPPTYPDPYVRPFLRWDPYGMRWDGPD
jgi:hypothetical protein